VAVKIRLKRLGKIRVPQYRIVVVDSRKKRDGRVIEEIGKYHPKEDPSYIDVVSDRALYWLGVGAQPTEAVEVILKITGDWQRHHGLEGTEGTLQVAAAKTAKIDIFNEALKDAQSEPKAGATTKKASAKKAPVEDKTEAPAEVKTDDKADKVEVTAGETPEAATEAAETAETAQVDAEQAADKGTETADAPSADTKAEA
jgi:small subunit ribosomal protein S16